MLAALSRARAPRVCVQILEWRVSHHQAGLFRQQFVHQHAQECPSGRRSLQRRHYGRRHGWHRRRRQRCRQRPSVVILRCASTASALLFHRTLPPCSPSSGAVTARRIPTATHPRNRACPLARSHTYVFAALASRVGRPPRAGTLHTLQRSVSTDGARPPPGRPPHPPHLPKPPSPSPILRRDTAHIGLA